MAGTRPYRMGVRAASTERTRRRLLSAARAEFLTRPYDDVRLARVAAAAGVSQQTLLNHFTSKENLFLAVLDELGAEIRAARAPVPRGDVDAAVAQLLREYEEYGDAYAFLLPAVERAPDLLGGVLATARTTHTSWLADVFGDVLPHDPRHRRRVLAALYASTDVGTWKLLRRDLGRSRAETGATLRLMLRAVLAAAAGP
ncbi:TetR/AcrR family transcriptional regulator [Kineococcus terrestris]|uniref:TetR/AcrR family transcriptional regulator n=1 Tax=Kineococcus terrestris TaxID=2044856 RepID=UPI0034DAFC78